MQALRTQLTAWSEKYDQNYRPLRNKVYAHRALKENVEIQALAKKTNINEVEDLLVFLYRLANTLIELFTNGTRPKLSGRNFEVKRELQDGVHEILQILSRGYESV